MIESLEMKGNYTESKNIFQIIRKIGIGIRKINQRIVIVRNGRDRSLRRHSDLHPDQPNVPTTTQNNIRIMANNE